MTAPSAGRALDYCPGLDGIRALAALAVVGFHARIAGFADGSIGVDVFFTLSGYLITSLLLADIARRGRVDLTKFYVRRALRLLPAYLVVVLAAVVGDFVVDTGGTLKGAALSLVYLANWGPGLTGMGLGSLGHTWTLSIEEQFYLAWPIGLVAIVAWSRRRSVSPVLVIAGLVVTSYGLAWVLLSMGLDELAWNATPTRAVELLAGGLLAVALPRLGRVAKARMLPAAGVVALAYLAYDAATVAPSRGVEILVGWPLIALATSTLVLDVVAARGPLPRLLAAGPLVYIGKRSYGLYLWHFPVMATVDQVMGLDRWAPRLLSLAIIAVVVPLSYRYVEQPFLRLKDRFPRRSADAVAEPSALPA